MKPINPDLALHLSEIKSDTRLNLKVPDFLKNADPLIKAFKEEIKENKYLNNGLHRGWDSLNLQVSPKSLDRSLLFMDTLIKALKARGHIVEHESRKTFVTIREQKIEISFREKLKALPPKDKYSSRDMQPTGVFSFRADIKYLKEWIDGKSRVEDQLPRILAELELGGDTLFEQAQERQRYWDEQKAKDQIIKDAIQKQENEVLKVKALLSKAKRLQDARLLRDYAACIKDETEKLRTLKIADWYDPTIEAEDELLQKVDRETLVLTKPMYF